MNDPRNKELWQGSVGLDIGSAYVSATVLDFAGELAGHEYRRHHGNVAKTVREVMSRLAPGRAEGLVGIECSEKALADHGPAAGMTCCVTGDGAPHISTHPHTRPLSLDPAIALFYGVKHIYPDVRNIIYIGAGSFYLIILNDKGEYLKHTANTACASGTGAFLDQQAIRLGTTPAELHELARRASSCPAVATRCAVFAKTDIIHLQQAGYGKEDIAAGICRGMAESTLDVLLKGKTLSGRTVVVGGVARNSEIVKHLEQEIGFSVDVPANPELAGALGAAVYAASEGAKPETRNPKPVAHSPAQEPTARLRKPALTLEKSSYPDFSFFDFRINEDETEVTLIRKPEAKQYNVVIGIDIGSTSTKAIVVPSDREPLLAVYRKTAGNPVGAIQLLFKAMREELERFGVSLNILGVGTTGSGRKLMKKVIRADVEMNEITAHARAAVHIDPKVDTILEIGGQDAKFTQLANGVVYSSTMNYVCAAGTGSFIEEQAKRLGISIWDYGDEVLGVSPPKTSDRCTVFMERDLDMLLAQGWSQKEVAAAVLYSVCDNYLNKVVAGQHIGDRVYFQGATARNKALVAAFERTLGKAMIVSPYCHLTGAYGMALLLLDQGVSSSGFRGLDFADSKVEAQSEKCTLCRNECELTVIDVAGDKVGWGMKCGREYSERVLPVSGQKRKPHYELFRLRRRFLRELSGKDPENPAFTVGIPMGLTFYSYLPLWGTFLRELGGKVVLSGGTTKEILKRGLRFTQAEFCAPVVASHGHVSVLEDSAQDFIFLPQMIRGPVRESFSESYFCPFVQGHPAIIKSTKLLAGYRDKFVSPVVQFPLGQGGLARSLYAALKPVLNVSLAAVTKALRAGLGAQEEFDRRLKEEGRKCLKNLAESGQMGVVIFGRPYNVNDPGLNVNLPEKTAEMGVTVIPMDFIAESELDARWSNMYWHQGQAIMSTARTVVDSDNLFGILFSNFCCGPDSYLMTYFKEIMAERHKPFLVVQFDAHGADAGYVTRVEAALESFKAWRPRPTKSPKTIRKVTGIDRNRTVFFPPMDAVTARFFAAAFQGEGIRAEILREDEETLDIGYKHTLGGECVPCPSTLGSFIKMIEDRNLSPSEVALFMPTATGPCRFGQYACLDRIVFERKGWDEIEIISPSEENAYLGLPASLRKALWKGIVCSDVLAKMLLKTRPYETTPGSADKALAESVAKLCDCFRAGGRGVREAVTAAVTRFMAVEREQSHKPKVGIVGETYVRHNTFINQDVVGWIERLGGEVLRTSLAEWFLYSAFMYRVREVDKSRTLLKRIENRLHTFFFTHIENGFYDLAKEIIHDRHEPEIKEVIEAGKRYVPLELEGESILTVGRALLFIEREGVDAVVNVSPSFCMPGTTTTAIFARIEEEKGIPIICNFYDGSGEPNRVLRPHLHSLTTKIGECAGG